MEEQSGNLTFAIIKPDAVSAGHTGKIIDKIITGGFRIRAMKMIHQSRKQAEGFYEVHRGKPFYEGLTEFMSSGPCVVMVLEKEGAVKAWRDLMGATDPAKADAGTLRKEVGASVGENVVHGSDSEENARIGARTSVGAGACARIFGSPPLPTMSLPTMPTLSCMGTWQCRNSVTSSSGVTKRADTMWMGWCRRSLSCSLKKTKPSDG